MGFITIEKVDNNNRSIREERIRNTNGYCLLAIISFILSIISLFIGGKYAIYILPISLVLSFSALKRIKKTMERGKGLAITSLLISLIYLIIIISMIFVNRSVVNKTTKSAICSMTNSNGYYYKKDNEYMVLCNNFRCSIQKNGKREEFSCIDN